MSVHPTSYLLLLLLLILVGTAPIHSKLAGYPLRGTLNRLESPTRVSERPKGRPPAGRPPTIMAKRRSSFSKKGSGGGTKKGRKAIQDKRAAKRGAAAAGPNDEGAAVVTPKQKKKKKKSKATSIAKDERPLVQDDDGSLALAADLFRTLPLNVWWRTFEDPDGEIDLSVGTRQDWDLIIPLYIKAGLYRPPSAGTIGNKIQFDKDRWGQFVVLLEERHGLKMEVTPIYRKGGGLSHFVIIRSKVGSKKWSAPRYGSPIRQEAEVNKFGLSAIGINSLGGGMRKNTRQNNEDDATMKDMLETSRSDFVNSFLSYATEQLQNDRAKIDSIKPYATELAKEVEEALRTAGDTATTTNAAENRVNDEGETKEGEEHQPSVPSKPSEASVLGVVIENQINDALELDFAARPRMKRVGEGEIVLPSGRRYRKEESTDLHCR